MLYLPLLSFSASPFRELLQGFGQFMPCDIFPGQIFQSFLSSLWLLMLNSHHDFSFKLCYITLITHRIIIIFFRGLSLSISKDFFIATFSFIFSFPIAPANFYISILWYFQNLRNGLKKEDDDDNDLTHIFKDGSLKNITWLITCCFS